MQYKDGVVMYTRDNIDLREDLNIFIESISNGHSSIIWEIHRTPDTNVTASI